MFLLSWCLCQIELSLTALNGHQQPWRCSWLNLAKRKSMKTSARSERSAWCLRKRRLKDCYTNLQCHQKKKKKRSVQSSHSTALEKHKQKGICAVFFSPFLYLLQVTIATLNTLTHILLLLLYSPPGFFFFFLTCNNIWIWTNYAFCRCGK